MQQNSFKWFFHLTLVILFLYIASFAILSRRNVSHLGLWRFLDRGGNAYIEEKIALLYWPLIKIDEKLFQRYYSSTLPD